MRGVLGFNVAARWEREEEDGLGDVFGGGGRGGAGGRGRRRQGDGATEEFVEAHSR